MAFEDFDEKIKDSAKRKVKSYAKKKMRAANKITLFLCLLALLGGAVFGVYAYEYICQDDCFILRGEKEQRVALNTPDFIYYEDGVKVIEFGRDISKNVVTKTNMQDLGGGRYAADTTVPGKYYIKYTIDSPKYGEVCRIRTIVVGGEG